MLLQVVLQSQIAEEEGLFSLDDVIQKAGEKMIRRHPHVFSSEAAPEKEEVPGAGRPSSRRKSRESQQNTKSGRRKQSGMLPAKSSVFCKRNHSKKSRISLDKRPKTVYK